MRIVFGSWKYLFKNLWYILPFAVAPGVFLTLSVDYGAISDLMRGFFSGTPRAHFLTYFSAFSLLRIDLLGGIYNICAFLCIAVFMTLMLSLVEKHMRLGKRTGSGAFAQFGNLLLSALGITLAYFVLYEIWAVVLSAVMFAVASVKSTVIVYLLDAGVFILFAVALLYLVTVCYLWFPCKQVTGFGNYDAFLYSYRLMSGVRGRLVLSLSISALAIAAAMIGLSFVHELIFCGVAFFLFTFAFLNFCVRMETVYFAADKIDREDLLRSYREL